MAISKKAIIYPADQWPKQIGKRYYPTKKTLTYIDIIKDESAWIGGWIDPKKYLPHALDICLMKINGKEVHGWWDGTSWRGYRVKKGQVATVWKRTCAKHGVYDNNLVRNI